MKILLIGKNGQVGWELQRSLSTLGEVVAVDYFDKELCGDLTDLAGIAQTVRQVKPDVVVNAAAHTAVDKAESERELSDLLNERGVAVLAEESAKLGALMVHYSTDYVFDGEGEHYRPEDEATGPLNVYGETKRAGELALALANPRHLIFRTSWVYATRGANFAKTMLRLAGEKETLSIINDQHGRADRLPSCWRTVPPSPFVKNCVTGRLPGPTIWWPAVKPAGMTMPALSLMWRGQTVCSWPSKRLTGSLQRLIQRQQNVR
ncbi:dTDP-4-dehydrorhamnose reductase [Raoultella terrigena]|nr:dTDP-4-dehydrorhamnose reductase [Raoultella terrigena]